MTRKELIKKLKPYWKKTMELQGKYNLEIYGLEKTMSLYIKLPRKYWPDIKIAEQDNEKGEEMFNRLIKLIK